MEKKETKSSINMRSETGGERKRAAEESQMNRKRKSAGKLLHSNKMKIRI